MIRGAEAKDAEAIASLAGELGYPSTVAEVAPRLARLLASPDDVVLVAVEGEQVAGWIHVAIDSSLENDPRALIQGLVVGESFRARGLGAELVRAGESWAREQGVRQIRVRTNVVRERTHRFYEREGYTRTKQSLVFDKSLV